MKQNYPGKNVSIDFLYNGKLKGGFQNKENDKDFANTCAIRMSYALVKSGFALHKAKGSIQGGDGKWYWTRVDVLGPELVKRFKGFDSELKFDEVPVSAGESEEALKPYVAARKAKAQQFMTKHMNGKAGIVMFRVKGWETARGHFTLWDGKELAYANGHDDPRSDSYYFWLTTTDVFGLGLLVQVTHIQFWELK